MNEISRQHNDLIDLPLRKFNASEIDILLALCYKCQEQGTNEVILPFDQIRQLADYKAKDEKQFLNAIEETNRKLMNLNFKIGDDRDWVQFVLFPTFEVSSTNQTVKVAVNEKFAYLLNDLTENFTRVEIQESNSLKSAYAKAIYKKLRKWRDVGIWTVSLEDFKEYLDIPKSYKAGHIQTKVLIPSVEELKPYFKGLKVEPVTEKKTSGRGRPSLTGYRFTFQKQPHTSANPKSLTQEQIADKTGWVRTGKFCPKCKREIYSSFRENENGTYTLYGHADWKTGDCNYTTYDIANLLEEYQVHESDPETPEQTENKKKLKGLFSGLFG